tara:strand:+ start:58 stop:540 length:483 start_codon:yes stop_codon:yes gene_type:complete
MISAQERDKVWDLIEPLGTCMMATWNGDFAHARPMHHVGDFSEGTLLYFTRLGSDKVVELNQHHDVCLAYACPKDQTYVSLSGVAETFRDQALIDEYWNSFVGAWFPEGKDDASVGLIRVHVSKAEYWDSTSNKMVQLFEIAKANLTDTLPDMGENKKLG